MGAVPEVYYPGAKRVRTAGADARAPRRGIHNHRTQTKGRKIMNVIKLDDLLSNQPAKKPETINEIK